MGPIACASFQDADTLRWRGALALLATDRLEAAGYRVEVHAFLALEELCVGEPGYTVHIVPLKAADEPLDVERLAVTLVHPGFTRGPLFSSLVTLAHREGWEISPVLGHPRDLDDAAAEKYLPEGTFPTGSRVLPNVFSLASALAALNVIAAELSEETD
jgi:hypothetical protein